MDWIGFTYGYGVSTALKMLLKRKWKFDLSQKMTAWILVTWQQFLEMDISKISSSHVAKEKGEKSNHCKKCGFASLRADDLRTHMKTHSGGKLYQCNQCDYASTQASSLRTHLNAHLGEKSHKCNLCDYASVQATNLRTHMKIHTGEKSYKCNQCDYASVQANNLKTWAEMVIPRDRRIFLVESWD